MEGNSTETGYETVRCPVCGEEKPEAMMLPGELVRSSLAALIRREHPKWSRDQAVCYDDLSRYRLQRSREVLRRADEKLKTGAGVPPVGNRARRNARHYRRNLARKTARYRYRIFGHPR